MILQALSFCLAVLSMASARTTTLGPQVTTDSGILAALRSSRVPGDISRVTSEFYFTTDENERGRSENLEKFEEENDHYEDSTYFSIDEGPSNNTGESTQTESYPSFVQLSATTESDWSVSNIKHFQSTVEAPPDHEKFSNFSVIQSVTEDDLTTTIGETDLPPTVSLIESIKKNSSGIDILKHEPGNTLVDKAPTLPRAFILLSKISPLRASSPAWPVTQESKQETWELNPEFMTTEYNVLKTDELVEENDEFTTQEGRKLTTMKFLTPSPKPSVSQRSQDAIRLSEENIEGTKHRLPQFSKLNKTNNMFIESSHIRMASPYALSQRGNSKSNYLQANFNRIVTVPKRKNESSIIMEQPSQHKSTHRGERVSPSYRESYDRSNDLLVSGRAFNIIRRRVPLPKVAPRGTVKFNLTALGVDEMFAENRASEQEKEFFGRNQNDEMGTDDNTKKKCGSGIENCISETVFPSLIMPVTSGGKRSKIEISTKKWDPEDSSFSTQFGRKERQLSDILTIKKENSEAQPHEKEKELKRMYLFVKKPKYIETSSLQASKISSENLGKAISSQQPTAHAHNESKSSSSNAPEKNDGKEKFKSPENLEEKDDSTSEPGVGFESSKLERNGNEVDGSDQIVGSKHDARQLPIFPTSNLRPRPSEVQYPWSGSANYPYRRYSQASLFPLQPYNLIGYNNRYNYGYGVADGFQGTYFGQVENRQQGVTQGQYFVDLPDGRRMIVTYVADGTGYYPIVTYQQRPTVIVPGTAQEIPNFNPLGTNARPSLQYPFYPNTNRVYNLGPGHGLVTDEHFLDNHGLHFTPIGPNHIHDQDGPVFGFDRRPISIPSSGSSQPSNVGTPLRPNVIGNNLQPNFIGSTSQPNFDGTLYPNPYFFPYQPQYPNVLYPYPSFWITPVSQFYPNFAQSATPDQPSFASSHPPSAPNFGVAISPGINNPQGPNFRPGTGNSFGFSNRNSLIREAPTNTIEEHLEHQNLVDSGSSLSDHRNVGPTNNGEKRLGTTVETDYVTTE